MTRGRSPRIAGAAAVLAAALGSGCLAGAGPEPAAVRSGALVYGDDDRREAFEVSDPAQRDLMSRSMVAIVPRAALRQDGGEPAVEAPSWGERANLCPGERFAEQPSAALCSGILVDWDLVLTAGHCVRVFGLQDLAVVFDYEYSAPGALRAGDVRQPVKIVAEALDPQGASPRLDYAWLRLDRPVGPPRRPARIHVAPPPIAAGAPLVAVGAGGGVPMKLDAGGHVRDPRAGSDDYFLADTDTTGGASGGGAFDADLALLGILSRGGTDLMTTASGCNTLVHAVDGAEPEEQFTWAHEAARALCDADPTASSICRLDCGSPCEALPPAPAGGCTVGAGDAGELDVEIVLLALAAAIASRRASSSRRSAGTTGR
jgi:hypothetical protein